MGVTTERSTILKTQEGTLTTALTRTQRQMDLKVQPFDFTQGAAAGDATSTQGLVKMPAGKHTVIGMVVACSAFGSSRVLDIGYEAHTKSDNATAVNALATAFAEDLDVSAAATVFIPLNVAMDSVGGYGGQRHCRRRTRQWIHPGGGAPGGHVIFA
ncbi:MAG: hypothetical protein IPK75_20590 [Acidobacteria bacterium]|nr:hypothetical protein [Acidobacteriota bacterium]